MNLEALRRKRVKRLGVKATNHTGQRRIFFILDRATRKFYGDIGLWIEYLTFTRKQKSNKKVAEILTRVLRLHPTKSELWIYAANYALEERGDMLEARSYMQRGLRFCGKSGKLWIEYARLELIYIAKIVGRRRVLGLSRTEEPKMDKITKNEDEDRDVISLPVITSEDISPQARFENIDQNELQEFDKSSAFSGAIPMAVFDSAYKQLGDEEIAIAFFDLVAEFDQLPCKHTILDHIMDRLRSRTWQTPASLVRYVQLPVVGIDFTSAGFPSALGIALSRIKPASKSLESNPASSVLDLQLIRWFLLLLEVQDLDVDIKKILDMTLQKVWNHYQTEVEASPEGKHSDVKELLERFDSRGMQQIARIGRSWAEHVWAEQ